MFFYIFEFIFNRKINKLMHQYIHYKTNMSIEEFESETQVVNYTILNYY